MSHTHVKICAIRKSTAIIGTTLTTAREIATICADRTPVIIAHSVKPAVPKQSQPELRPRVNTKRLLTVLLLAGVMPLSLLIGLDVLLGWMPLLTLVGLVIFIPLGSFLVIRTALEEFSRIIEDVAPVEPDETDGDANQSQDGSDADALQHRE
ncbi:MAG: hypothetical protein KDE20_01455 [Caldilineaceae bacterium]|nr:hypothetical protein [Caldilineaceae bacterium]